MLILVILPVISFDKAAILSDWYYLQWGIICISGIEIGIFFFIKHYTFWLLLWNEPHFFVDENNFIDQIILSVLPFCIAGCWHQKQGKIRYILNVYVSEYLCVCLTFIFSISFCIFLPFKNPFFSFCTRSCCSHPYAFEDHSWADEYPWGHGKIVKKVILDWDTDFCLFLSGRSYTVHD